MACRTANHVPANATPRSADHRAAAIAANGLGIITLATCLVPARRATRIHAVVAYEPNYAGQNGWPQRAHPVGNRHMNLEVDAANAFSIVKMESRYIAGAQAVPPARSKICA